MAKLVSINVSETKGVRKKPVPTATISATGIVGDGHSGEWDRMVSLLAEESIEKMRAMGLNVGPGDFAENLTTSGIDLLGVPIGGIIRVGKDVVLEVTRHGKECHARCAIYHQAGDCVMPKEGIFARVIKTGEIHTGDAVEGVPAEKA